MELRLALALAAVVAAAFASQAPASPSGAPCRITPSSGAGPFGGSGVAPPRRAKIGTGHVLTGRVLRYPDCRPLKGAVVDYWQRGPRGYTPAFRGRVVTAADGSFRIEGPVPTRYEGRDPHIHLAVSFGGYEPLGVTYFVRKGSKSGRLTLVLEPLL